MCVRSVDCIALHEPGEYSGKVVNAFCTECYHRLLSLLPTGERFPCALHFAVVVRRPILLLAKKYPSLLFKCTKDIRFRYEIRGQTVNTTQFVVNSKTVQAIKCDIQQHSRVKRRPETASRCAPSSSSTWPRTRRPPPLRGRPPTAA